MSAVAPDSVTVTYGEEVFSPVQHNSFRLGPFSYTTALRANETPESAMGRAHEHLIAFAAIEYKRKAQEFVLKLEYLTKVMGGR